MQRSFFFDGPPPPKPGAAPPAAASPAAASPGPAAPPDAAPPPDAVPPPEALSAALEAALLRELRARYDWREPRAVRRPAEAAGDRAVGLRRRGSAAGCAPTRTLELSRALVRRAAVAGGDRRARARDGAPVRRRGARASTTRPRTARRSGGCAPSAASTRAPRARAVAGRRRSAEVDRVLERIRKLLALAGSPNQHEAEIAMRKAHELMLRHNIEASAARARASLRGPPPRRSAQARATRGRVRRSSGCSPSSSSSR